MEFVIRRLRIKSIYVTKDEMNHEEEDSDDDDDEIDFHYHDLLYFLS